MHVLVTAFFLRRVDAGAALASCAEQGFGEESISVIPKHVNHPRELGLRAATKAPEGAAMGALAGAVVGAVAAAIVGAGSIVVPGADAVIAGRIVAALAGASVAGALGWAVGAVIGSQRPEYEAAVLPDAVGLGGALVSIRCTRELASAVTKTLEDNGANGVRVVD